MDYNNNLEEALLSKKEPVEDKKVYNNLDINLKEWNDDIEDLLKCWAVVNHNSSSIVGPIVKGYPAFVTDPERSQCAEVAHYGFEDIENPKEFDREKWLQRISMFHWKLSELRDGTCWRHMREFVQ